MTILESVPGFNAMTRVEAEALGIVIQGRGRKPALSASALNSFFSDYGCQMEYFWKYVRRFPRTSNLALVRGIAVDHAISEGLRHYFLTGSRLPADELQALMRDRFKAEAGRPEVVIGPDEDPDRILLESSAMLAEYAAGEMLRLEPQSAEDIQRRFTLHLPDRPFDLAGVIDYCGHRLDADGELRRILVDFKTRKKPANPEADRLQATIYALAVETLFPGETAAIEFHQMLPPSPEWPGEVAVRLKKDGTPHKVQPRPPEGAKVVGPGEPLTVTPGSVRWFWRMFDAASAVIAAGTYVPAPPTFWKCAAGRCDVWSVCRGAVQEPAPTASKESAQGPFADDEHVLSSLVEMVELTEGDAA